MESTPPAAPVQEKRKRPLYLMLALVLSWIFGFGAMTGGCGHLAFYYDGRFDPTLAAQSIVDPADKAHVVALAERQLDALEAAKPRLFPLAAASMLLGAAIVGLTAMVMAGRSGARAPLAQVVSAQAVVAVLNFALLPDLRGAELATEFGRRIALLKQEHPNEADLQREAQALLPVARAIEPVGPALRVLGSLFIVLALVRPRTRQFFEAPRVTER